AAGRRLRRLPRPRRRPSADLRSPAGLAAGAGRAGRWLLSRPPPLIPAHLWVKCWRMKRTEAAPSRTLAQSLLEDDALPAGFDAEELERARRLARSIPSASASDVESLPEPLALAVLEASVRSRDPRLADQLSSSGRNAI